MCSFPLVAYFFRLITWFRADWTKGAVSLVLSHSEFPHLVQFFDLLVYHLPCSSIISLLIKLAVLWRQQEREKPCMSVHDIYTTLSIESRHSRYKLSVTWLLIRQRFFPLVLRCGLLLFFVTKVSRLNILSARLFPGRPPRLPCGWTSTIILQNYIR